MINRIGSLFWRELGNNEYLMCNAANGALGIADADARDRILTGRPTQKEEQFLPLNADTSDGDLLIEVEMSTECNMDCPFCYQHGWECRAEIDSGNLESLEQYIAAVARLQPNRTIRLHFIGGEPLLHKKAIHLFYRGVRKSIQNPLFVHIDTNGTISMESLFSEIENISAMICISLPEDHVLMRRMRGRDTTSLILDNIASLGILSGSKSVLVRYNCHRENLDNFSDFVDWILSKRIPSIHRLTVARLENLPNEIKHLELSSDEFFAWRNPTAENICTARGLPSMLRIFGRSGLCKGHSGGSLKLWANGKVTPCMYVLPDDSTLTIQQLAADIHLLRARFPYAKQSPFASVECQKCQDSFRCRGHIICETKNCGWLEESQASMTELEKLMSGSIEDLLVRIENEIPVCD